MDTAGENEEDPRAENILTSGNECQSFERDIATKAMENLLVTTTNALIQEVDVLQKIENEETYETDIFEEDNE